MKGRTNVRYTFRHYPLNKECNPALPANVPAQNMRRDACNAARAAEAAGRTGGNDAYWKMHAWLMTNQASISREAIIAAAGEQKLDVEKFTAALDAPETAANIADDTRAAQQLGLTSLPYLLVNGKLVPRPLRDDDSVIKRILDDLSKK